jgi:hypothetical protein
MGRFFCVLTCVAFLSQPAVADSSYISGNNSTADSEIPVVLDAFFMRPLGVVVTALGFAAWTLNAPIAAATRPTDLHKTFKSLVINPARFTFVDPLGHHPDRSRAEERGEVR